jgi:hypothetical protein
MNTGKAVLRRSKNPRCDREIPGFGKITPNAVKMPGAEAVSRDGGQ